MIENHLRADALAIWRAGLDAVRSDRLVREHVCVEGNDLVIGDDRIPLNQIGRIVVVGAGKAGAGMATGLEAALGASVLETKRVTGWVNVPADCVRPLQKIHLHAARPAGLNEPTVAGVHGAEEILRLVTSLGENDLAICLISGGGSALLPAPIEGITLEDKQQITRHLSAAGANIQELNTVRKRLSRIKGGGLARACRAGRLITLIISDVLGDPIDMIASGPTVEDTTSSQRAWEVLNKFHAREAGIAPRVFEILERQVKMATAPVRQSLPRLSHYVIGNLAVAVDAAGVEAERRGYSHAMICATRHEGEAEDVGRQLAAMALQMRSEDGPDCLITGGEPTVRLAPASERGLGGRNQQLVLAALDYLASQGSQVSGGQLGPSTNPLEGLALLSGGTDGEDGPTDAAGAFIDSAIWRQVQQQQLDIADHLRRNDAYTFFRAVGGLIQTGPTHTNVCDLRVVVVART